MKKNKFYPALFILFLTSNCLNGFAQTAPINILNATPLASTAGDTKEVARFGNNTSNASRLLIYFWRNATGTNWLTATTRIQNVTDVTPQAYLDFNPPGMPGGLSIGTQYGPNALSITDAGLTGIGTTTPYAKLHVNRSAVLSGSAGQTAEILRLSGNISNTAHLVFFNFRHTTGSNWLSASTRLQSFTDVTPQGFLEFNPMNGPGGLSLGTAQGGNAININSAAAVGIGTWDTRGYKLAVVGGTLCDRIKVAVPGSASWSDHVFNEQYQLRPLEEVELYIKQNKHLPNIPSADEMVKEGNDLGRTDAKLLEKIEELTLYIIELKKEVNTQAKKIERLEQANKNNQ